MLKWFALFWTAYGRVHKHGRARGIEAAAAAADDDVRDDVKKKRLTQRSKTL